MEQIYSVSQVNQFIKNMFVREYALHNIAMKGEVSNCKYHPSGHIYFTLKDSTAGIACVMFAGQRKGLRFTMQNGQSVVIIGSIGVYERDGRYQLYANEIVLDGSGMLYEKFEKLKRALLEEGLFEEGHKKKIPAYVKSVGIVTADTGAAIQDIMNIAARRNPYVQLILYPAKVQGEGAAETIVEGIRALDKQNLDVLIVGRGGGSIEDLFAFNEEMVARAIYQCETPIISAVGHEVDTTISDFTADLRAPTPSAAAELAIYNIMDFWANMSGYEKLLRQSMERKISEYRSKVGYITKQLEYVSPIQKIQQKRLICTDLQDNLTNLMEQKLKWNRHRLEIYAERLKGLSPLHKLSGGYSYVTNKSGHALNSITLTAVGEEVAVILSDGSFIARVETIDKEKGMMVYGKEDSK